MGVGTTIAKKLRSELALARTRLGLSQQEVADRVALRVGLDSLSKQAISQWERFETQPRIDELAAWARAVGMRLDLTLLADEDDRATVRIPLGMVETVHRLQDLPGRDLELVMLLVALLSHDVTTPR